MSARVRERRASGRGVRAGAAVAMGSGWRGEASAEVGELLLLTSLSEVARGACAERRARRRGAGAERAVEGERASERKRRRISGE